MSDLAKEDYFYLALERQKQRFRQAIKIFIIFIILAFIGGYTLCFYLPVEENKNIVNFEKKIKNEREKVLSIRQDYSRKIEAVSKDLVKLKKLNKSTPLQHYKERVLIQKEIILKLEKTIVIKDNVISELNEQIDSSLNTEKELLASINSYNKSLARSKDANKVLFGATVGLGVTSVVLLGVIAGVFYFKP